MANTSYPKKPVRKPILRRQGMPRYWALADQERGTLPGDAGFLADATGRFASVTPTGGIGYGSGLFGRCLTLDGTGHAESVAGGTPLTGLSAGFTACGWFRVNSTSTSYGLWGNLAAAYNVSQFLFYVDSPAHVFIAAMYDPAVSTYRSSIVGTVNDTLWHFGYIKWSKKTALYATGMDNNQLSSNSAAATSCVTSPTTPLRLAPTFAIGGTTYDFLNGALDNLQLYDYPLSESALEREYYDPWWRFAPRITTVLLTAAGITYQHATAPKKPARPKIYHREGLPSAWFLMDEPRTTHAGDAGDVADTIGSVPAGVRHGGCAYTRGPLGNCLTFDGLTGYCQFPQLIPANGVFTLAGWVLPTAGSYAIVLDSRTPVAGTGVILYANGASGLANGFFWNGASATALSGGPSIYDGRWHHLALACDGTTAWLYRDGVQVDAAALTGGYATTSTQSLVANDYTGSVCTQSSDNLTIHAYPLTPAAVLREATDPWWRLRPASDLAFPLAMTSSMTITATFAATLGGARMAATGTVTETATFAATLDGARMAAAAVVSIGPMATFSATLDGATMTAAAMTVGQPAVQPETFTGTLAVQVASTFQAIVTDIVDNFTLSIVNTYAWASGDAAGQASILWTDDPTLAAVPRTYQLVGDYALRDVMGELVSPGRAKVLMVTNLSATDGETLTVSPGATNGWTTGFLGPGTTLAIPASGGILAWGFGATAMPMDATHCTLKFDPGTATFAANVILVGAR